MEYHPWLQGLGSQHDLERPEQSQYHKINVRVVGVTYHRTMRITGIISTYIGTVASIVTACLLVVAIINHRRRQNTAAWTNQNRPNLN